MTKLIIKEIIICILLLTIVVLVLGIIFYDYLPIDKQAPSKVQPYILDEETNVVVSGTASAETQNIIRTYQVSSSDLSIYEDAKEYEKGNPDPFQKVQLENPYNEETATPNENAKNTVTSDPDTQSSNDVNSTSKYYNSVSGK